MIAEEKDSQKDPSPYDWESRYKLETELPWDLNAPSPELVQYFQEAGAGRRPEMVIEVGCGTGANAIWLAKNNCSVTATEIAPTALETARARAKEANVEVDFRLLDICVEAPVGAATQDFAFDRGVFHIIAVKERAKFVANLALSLKPGAYWLCLAGSKDEARENPEIGPPQLTAMELIEHVEPLFAVVKLDRSKFVIPNGQTYLAWKALFQRR